MSALLPREVINCVVIAGLDPPAGPKPSEKARCLPLRRGVGPAIHPLLEMDARGKPAHDELCADAPCSPQSAVCAGHEPSRRRSQAGQAAALFAGPRSDAAAGRSAPASAE